jgi:hypothetical protein
MVMPAFSWSPQVWRHLVTAFVVILLTAFMLPRRSLRGGASCADCQLQFFLTTLMEIPITTSPARLLATRLRAIYCGYS